MSQLTPQELTAKWQQRTTAAIPDAQKGVQNVTKSPMEAAANNKDKWAQNVAKAAANGRFEAGLRKVSLEEWKTNTIKKMGERIAGGVQSAQAKHQRFAEYLIPTVAAGQAKVAAMPSMTLQDSIQRAAAMMTHMAQNPYRK